LIKISATVSAESIAKCKAAIDRKIAQKVAETGSYLYNSIVGDRVDTPYWSGAYIASWRYHYGSIDHSYEALPTNKSGAPNIRHTKPKARSIIPNYTNPYMPLYVSNSVPHAYQVENIGTPNHPEPWKVAVNAVNILKYGV
jgi:hypothetical protein